MTELERKCDAIRYECDRAWDKYRYKNDKAWDSLQELKLHSKENK